MNIEITTEDVFILEALASATRLKIINLVAEKPMNIKSLSEALGISSAIVTKHIQQLQNAGIIKSESVAGVRGMQKVCSLNIEQITLRLAKQGKTGNYHRYSMPVGHYSRYSVRPTCGLASETGLIGVLDDPRFFADPQHVDASMLWFGSGWVEYMFPNYLLYNQKASSLQISLEICSEAPGYNENWPSDISFYINGVLVGSWTSPGDFGGERGVLTPAWWRLGTTHGLLKTLTVNKTGSYIDGIRISDVSIEQLGIEGRQTTEVRIANDENAVHKGGISLFGKSFGNYAQDIGVTVEYEEELPSA